ncbi:MAG: MFS transporter [Caldilineales bacterium]
MRVSHSQASSALHTTFSALHHANYRLWFIGQLVSLAGTWMQTTAQGYLVYELTQSASFLGYVGFAAGIPSWAFTLYGGLVADRFSRRTIIILAQAAMMLWAFILAWLVFSGQVQPWHVVALALLNGVANAFDAPARQAFVVELVTREDMTNAIALNSTMFNAAAVLGPAIAGVVYAVFGPAWCFTLNGLSYLAVIAALLLMHIARVEHSVRRGDVYRQLRQGVSFVAHDSVTRVLTLNMGMLSLFGLSMVTLFPAWSVDVLHGDVGTNGLLLGARGLGAMAGALLLASVGRRGLRGRLWTIGSFVMPVAMGLFTLTHWLPLSLLLLVFVGWGFMVIANSSNSLVQTRVPDALRGRVMSIFTLTFFGTMPIGSLLIGNIADRIGEPAIVAINAGIIFCMSALIWLTLPYIRRLE